MSELSSINVDHHQNRLQGNPVYAASGHVVGVGAGGVLVTVAFDPARGVTTGPSVTLEARVRLAGEFWPTIGLSDGGTLVYLAAESEASEVDNMTLVWYDRDGTAGPFLIGGTASSAGIAPNGAPGIPEQVQIIQFSEEDVGIISDAVEEGMLVSRRTGNVNQRIVVVLERLEELRRLAPPD